MIKPQAPKSTYPTHNKLQIYNVNTKPQAQLPHT